MPDQDACGCARWERLPLGMLPGETIEERAARREAEFNVYYDRYGKSRRPAVQWHAGPPDSEGDWWVVEVVAPGDGDPFRHVSHWRVERWLVDGEVRLAIAKNGGLLLLEKYPRQILAHAVHSRPEAPGPRAKLIDRRRDQ